MMRKSSNQRAAENDAMRKLYGLCHDYGSTDIVWHQWGKQIVTDYPREQWAERIERIPELYQDYIRSRIIREYGEVAELI